MPEPRTLATDPPEDGGDDVNLHRVAGHGHRSHPDDVDPLAHTLLTDQLVALAEGTEAEFMYRYESCADAGTTAALGIAAERIGGGVALSMRHDVTGYWNKALGFGFAEPVTADLIERVVGHYRNVKSPGATIQIAPQVQPTDWNEICARHELRRGTPWIKLACGVDDLRLGAGTTLRIGPVGPGSVQEWATVTLRGFGMPADGLADMFVASASHPGFRPFAAWDEDQIVATANLFIHGEVGSLNSAATLPTHRNRGAQSALIATRAEAALEAGCRWVVAETAKPGPGETNPSMSNLLRCGLQPMYERQNWTWSPVDQVR